VKLLIGTGETVKIVDVWQEVDEDKVGLPAKITRLLLFESIFKDRAFNGDWQIEI
jgi:hypothetical protein